MPATEVRPADLAAMKCHCGGTPSRGGINGHAFSDSCTCCRDTCHGIGLRYPELSVECITGRIYSCREEAHGHWKGDCPKCNGTSRIPAVTVEKLWVIAVGLGEDQYIGVIVDLENTLFKQSPMAMAAWGRLTDDERKDALAAAIGRGDEL